MTLHALYWKITCVCKESETWWELNLMLWGRRHWGCVHLQGRNVWLWFTDLDQSEQSHIKTKDFNTQIRPNTHGNHLFRLTGKIEKNKNELNWFDFDVDPCHTWPPTFFLALSPSVSCPPLYLRLSETHKPVIMIIIIKVGCTRDHCRPDVWLDWKPVTSVSTSTYTPAIITKESEQTGKCHQTDVVTFTANKHGS